MKGKETLNYIDSLLNEVSIPSTLHETNHGNFTLV